MLPSYVIGCTAHDGHVTEGLNRFALEFWSKCPARAASFVVLCIVELFLSSRWFTDGSLTSYIAADHEIKEVNGRTCVVVVR